MNPNSPKDNRQCQREGVAREVALGRRAKTIQRGFLGPVLKRWINADVAPIAALLRKVAVAYIEGDMVEVALLLDTPTAEIAGRERPLASLMEWSLRGKSPGRIGMTRQEHYDRSEELQTSFADDIVLAFLATAVLKVTRKASSVSFVLAACADAIRETVLGQFVTHIQGASAMRKLREKNPEHWQQKRSLNRICARLASQVKPQLDRAQERGLPSMSLHAKRVVEVVDYNGELRRLSLREPDAVDWEVMTLCWHAEDDLTSGEEFKALWLGFAGILLSACQRQSGWFDISEKRQRHGKHIRKTRTLVLSEEAALRIQEDADRWVSLGFQNEAMVVPPADGDYLTVKHRKTTGQRAPLGLTTDPGGTTPWRTGACALADSPWSINPNALLDSAVTAVTAGDDSVLGDARRERRAGASLRETLGEHGAADTLRMAESRRLASEPELYLPVTMDFRGRVYYRPTWVNPQSDDLGKSLLCFPLVGERDRGRILHGQMIVDHWEALAMHFSGLYGGPDKLDKAAFADRAKWFDGVVLERARIGGPEWPEADKPLTLEAHYQLLARGETDRIPIQLDGTCNGLQHLSAMVRDEEGAQAVNLTASSVNEPPADMYMKVADLAFVALHNAASREGPASWATRVLAAGITPDRKLCKGPVMVLPYGGTREAVRLAVKAAVLERLSSIFSAENPSPWHQATEDNYAAFKNRPLMEHPLFNQDLGLLSGLIWDCISPTIPRAMSLMSTLQAIGSYIGERGLSWRVGVGREVDRLWVTQAKSKAEQRRVTMRGFHLPDTVRRLTLNAHQNEVDPKAHRTGIVANFIHSQDAAHLAASVALFRAAGGSCVGAVHDMVMVRPSEAALMGRCLRDAFVDLYTVPGERMGVGPLCQPVRLLRAKGEVDEEYPDWYALAEAAGVAFPELGTYDITEVRDSAWFFS